MASTNSVLKAFKILEVVSEYPEGISLTDIANETGLAKSTVFDIVEALYEVDALYYKSQFPKRYGIGSKMFVMGQVYINNSNFLNTAVPKLKAFAEKHHMTVMAAKQLQNRLVCTYKYESKYSKIITSDVGDAQSLKSPGGGKCYISYMGKEERKQFIGDDAALAAELDEIKNCGYCVERDTNSEFIIYMSVPVFNFENKVVGVMIATALKGTFDVKSALNDLLDIASEVNKIQGFRNANRLI